MYQIASQVCHFDYRPVTSGDDLILFTPMSAVPQLTWRQITAQVFCFVWGVFEEKMRVCMSKVFLMYCIVWFLGNTKLIYFSWDYILGKNIRQVAGNHADIIQTEALNLSPSLIIIQFNHNFIPKSREWTIPVIVLIDLIVLLWRTAEMSPVDDLTVCRLL